MLFLVANVAPSSQVVKSLDRMGWDVPIVSHWGPAGGRFSELAGASAAKVHFIQTFSFSGKLQSEGGGAVFAALKKKYPEIKSFADVTPAVGIANAYDAMHLTRSPSPRPARPTARRFARRSTRSTIMTA